MASGEIKKIWAYKGSLSPIFLSGRNQMHKKSVYRYRLPLIDKHMKIIKWYFFSIWQMYKKSEINWKQK